MTLRVALVIDGDAKGATDALAATTAATKNLGQAATGASQQQTALGAAAAAGAAAFEGTAVAVSGSAAALNKHGQASEFSSMQLAELGHVARSVFGVLAAGGSPIQALAFESSRLVSILTIGPGGLGGTLSAVGKIVANFAPQIAGVSALIALTGIAVVAFNAMNPPIKSVDDALKDHKALIEDIKTAYGDAAKGLDDYAAKSNSVLGALARQNLTALTATARQTDAELLQAIGFGGTSAAKGGAIPFSAQPQFSAFSDEIKTLRAQVIAGKPDFDAFYAAIERKVDDNSSLRKAATDLVIATQSAYSLVGALDQAAAAAKLVDNNLANPALGSFAALAIQSRQNPRPELQFGVDNLAKQGQSSAAFDLQLQAINARSPAELAELARKQKSLDLDGQSITMALRQQEVDQAGALAYAQASHAISEEDRTRLQAANDNIAAAQLNLSLIGQGIAATSRLQFVQQNLAAAQDEAARNGTTVSAAYIAEMQKLGTVYGALQQQIAETQLSDSLAFDRSQLGRTPDQQSVASQLRAIYGDDTNSAQAQFLAGQIQINQALGEMKDLGVDVTKGFLSDFRTDLMQGSTWFQALGDAGVNALGKISDKLEDMAVQNLFANAFGGSSGSSSGGGNIISSLLGLFGVGGGATYSSPLAWAGLAKADGGMIRGPGTGTSDSIPARLSNGEFVTNARSTAKYRPLLEAINSGRGFAAGGFVSSLASSAANSNASGAPAGGMVFAPQNTYDLRGSNLTEAQLDAKLDARDKAIATQFGDAFRFYKAHPRRAG